MVPRPVILCAAACLALGCLPLGCRRDEPSAPPPATGPATSRPRPANSRPNSARSKPSPATTAPATRPATLPSVRAAREALRSPQPDWKSWWRQTGGPVASTRASQPATSTGPDPRRHIRAGDRALARGDMPAAVRHFRQAVAADPRDPDALRGLAVALTAAGQADHAVSVYRKLLALRPDDRTARYNLGVALCRLDRYGQAEKIFRDLLEADPAFVQARYNLATLCQAASRLAEAKRQWRKVVADAPHLASAHTSLAEVLTDLGDHHGAMMAYAEAAKLTKDAPSWLNLAASARAAGSYGRAIAATKRALELAPNDATIWSRLGDLLHDVYRGTGRRKLLAEAARAWQRSLALAPHQPGVRELLAAAEKVLKVAPTTLPDGRAVR